jgi:transketolase
MRIAFSDTIFELASQDERVIFITGDLGFSVMEPYMAKLPKQYVNAGVAEQNMTGIAAGMAMNGKIVFTYSIGNFPTLRCLEHVRNDVCYHNANVKIVCVGGGFSYGALGATHHATEDLAIMRALPNMVVVAPGDPLEAREATRAITAYNGPCYLRLGKAGEPKVHQGPIQFELGKAIRLRDGKDLTLIATGAVLKLAVAVAQRLVAEGVEARVLSMHTLKPIDAQAIADAASQTGAILTIEEHSIIGGLGGAVAEVLAELPGAKVPFRRLGLPSSFSERVGSQDYMLAQHGLDENGILKSVRSLLGLAEPVSAAVIG